MDSLLARVRGLVEASVPWIILVMLLALTYARFEVAPYAGFYFTVGDGKITGIFVDPPPDPGLKAGDQLVNVGGVSWETYASHLRQQFYAGVQPGEVVRIVVLREGQPVEVDWVFPGPQPAEVVLRLMTPWWLAYIFWICGTLTQLILHPRDLRWRLLIAFNFLTAVWLMAGTFSVWHVWESAILLRMAIWLCVPFYFHLHWVFPRSLGRLPAALLWALYLAGALLAVLQWFELLPPPVYFLGFLLALLASLVLLVVHYLRQPEERQGLRLLVASAALAVLPAIGLGVTGMADQARFIGQIALVGLSVIPVAYLYVAYRRQLGGLELRANQAISLYIYAILLLSALIPLAMLSSAWLSEPAALLAVGVGLALLAGLFTAGLYPRYLRWIERRLLGMPLPPAGLLESYTARVTASLENERLVRLVRDEVLPSLLVRQAALLRLDSELCPTVVFRLGVEHEALPRPDEVADLLAQAGRAREPGTGPCGWARLALALQVGGRPVGLCLLGRRDPEDRYPAAELPALQALVDQTAVALLNIEQANHLRALYQLNIERQEAERSRLARGLHDDVLGQLAVLAMNAGQAQPSAQFEAAYQATVQHLREIISGLRPAMLNYGLRAALDEMVDEMALKLDQKPAVLLELPASERRYPPEVELHLYRIVQQAVRNAVQHAQARRIHIHGRLEAGEVALAVMTMGGLQPANGRPGRAAGQPAVRAGRDAGAGGADRGMCSSAQAGAGDGVAVRWRE
jgi:signal transduction histidine kinase